LSGGPIGVASGIKNRAMLISTADNRARAEIAKILETYVAYLAKDYIASTTAGDMEASTEEQHVEQALKTFTKTTLHGTQIIDRWRDPADGSLFSVCEMDLFAFKDALDEYKELDAQARDYVRENAEKLHRELERMERER
jgi:cytosine/adenosine deaminase-related metal-dependent hydrolase